MEERKRDGKEGVALRLPPSSLRSTSATGMTAERMPGFGYRAANLAGYDKPASDT